MTYEPQLRPMKVTHRDPIVTLTVERPHRPGVGEMRTTTVRRIGGNLSLVFSSSTMPDVSFSLEEARLVAESMIEVIAWTDEE